MASKSNVCKHGYMVPPCGCFVDEFVAPSAPAASGEPTPDLPSEVFDLLANQETKAMVWARWDALHPGDDDPERDERWNRLAAARDATCKYIAGLRAEAEAGQRKIAALTPYLWHGDDCPFLLESLPCTCGLAALIP